MERAPGKIITFYSYKGGTGRSMTLANVAWILASNGKRVLVVDWDLEAPGLHRYFSPFLVDKNLTSSEGVIDFVIDYATEAMTPPQEGEVVPRDWYVEHADLARYAASLEWDGWDFPGEGTLDFVSAGCQGPSYSTRVNTFDWQSFYDRHGGGVFLETVKEKLREEYDYVLLDSRTGVSDTSGICTVQMPDVLAVCFTLNNQSIEGAAAIAASVSRQRGDSGLRIFPVPMRIELAETDKLEVRRVYARRRFALFPEHLDGGQREQYWSDVEMLYVPYYAYEEVLAVFKDRPGATVSLLGAAERLTSHLTGGEVQRLAQMPEPVRQEVLAAYARRAGEEVQEDELSRIAETAFTGLSPGDQGAARNLLTRLVRVEQNGTAVRARVPLRELDPYRPILQSLLSAGVLAVETEPSAHESIVQLADEGFIVRWSRLRDWIDKDRDFLLWRQSLQARMAEWESSRRPSGALLGGGLLQAARIWRKLHREDLTDREQGYIRASVRKRTLHGAGIAAAIVILFLAAGFGYWTWEEERDRQLAAEATLSADTAMQQGDVDRAMEKYNEAIALNPKLANAYLGRGRVYSQKKDLNRATRDFTTAVFLDPKLADAYLERGKVHWKKGAFAQASLDFDQALQRDPSSEEAVLAKKDFLASRGSSKKALETIETAVKRNPMNPKFQKVRGDLLIHEGKNERAVQSYTAAIQLGQKTAEHDEWAYFNRGLALLNTGNKKEAAADFRHVSKHATDRDLRALRTAATAQLEKLQGSTILDPVRLASVYLHYKDASDAEAVGRLAELLEKREFKVVGQELVQGARTSGDVRYFFEQDKGQAAEVQQAVEEALAQAGFPVKLELIFRSGQQFKDARPRLVEVWLSSLSTNRSF
jgi:tetratricopeptide (TPR) repeat protein